MDHITTLRKLHPNQSPEELLRMDHALTQYFEIALEIYLRSEKRQVSPTETYSAKEPASGDSSAFGGMEGSASSRSASIMSSNIRGSAR